MENQSSKHCCNPTILDLGISIGIIILAAALAVGLCAAMFKVCKRHSAPPPQKNALMSTETDFALSRHGLSRCDIQTGKGLDFNQAILVCDELISGWLHGNDKVEIRSSCVRDTYLVSITISGKGRMPLTHIGKNKLPLHALSEAFVETVYGLGTLP